MRDRIAGVGGVLPARRGLLITLLLILVAFEVATVAAVVLAQRVRTERALLCIRSSCCALSQTARGRMLLSF